MRYWGIRVQVAIMLGLLMAIFLLLISTVLLRVTSDPLIWKVVILYGFLNIFFLLLMGVIMLSRWFISPLNELVSVTEEIAEGRFDHRVRVYGYNEIGQLAKSFNIMCDRLRENQGKLAQNIRNLEETNRCLKETQQQLIHSEKMASVGRLAAGVAHEIGNPLGIILGYLEILKGSSLNAERGREYLMKVITESQRIDEIIKGLLDYSRPSKITLQEFDLNELLRDCLELVLYQKEFRKIEPALDLDPHLPLTSSDRDKLKQVIMNLLLNAGEAMPDGGNLTISTALIDTDMETDKRGIGSNQRRYPGKSVWVSITDTGVGIASEDVDKVFEPFYTKKGEGTGLGLAVSYQIIQSLGGRIEVKSSFGEGSTFTIFLPLEEK